jgi:hypothetical protein
MQSEKGRKILRKHFRHGIWALALSVSLGLVAGTVQAVAAPMLQDHDRDHDYSKSKAYQRGLREGRADEAHHRDKKGRHFDKDEDQKAYDAGYEKGRGH